MTSSGPGHAADMQQTQAGSRALAGWLALVLLLGLAGCGSDLSPSPLADDTPSPRPALEPQPTPAIAPAAVSVDEVVQLPGSETGRRVFAVLLSGGAGTTAVERSLEIRAWTEPIEGSSCGHPPMPSVLAPGHPEAVQPGLADRTRTVRVRPTSGLTAPGAVQSESGAGSLTTARFRYGPVPSLNGDFEGWVSFGFATSSDEGFCAFDLRGEVVLVASGRARAELPVVRVDTRDRLDGSFDDVTWAARLDDYEGRPLTIDALTADELPVSSSSDDELLDALEALALTAASERASLRAERPPGGVCYFAAWAASVELLSRWQASVDGLAAQLLDGTMTADGAHAAARSFPSSPRQVDDLVRAIGEARTTCAGPIVEKFSRGEGNDQGAAAGWPF